MDAIQIDTTALEDADTRYVRVPYNPSGTIRKQAKLLPCNGCWRRKRCQEACKRFEEYVSYGR